MAGIVPRGELNETVIGLRIGGAGALLLAALLGIFMAGKLERDSRARVEVLAAAQTTLAEAQSAASKRTTNQLFDQEAFAAGAKSDAVRFGIEGFDFLAFAGPHRYVSAVTDSVSVAPGKSWSSEHLKVRVELDKVQYKQHGATVSARHTIAKLENISKVPVAYFARLRSDERGLCEVRGARQHNAMGLMPGESAEVVVCAGTGRVRIERLEVLELSELGYYYVSRVPPRAVGHDGITAGSHSPMQRGQMCRTVDVAGIAGKLDQGLTRWRDVVDYYARHDCERFRFPLGYRHDEAGPKRLPALPS